MRFFERQDEIRRKTLQLGLLFAVAVAGVVWLLNRLPFLLLLFLLSREYEGPRTPGKPPPRPPTAYEVAFVMDPGLSLLAMVVIGAGTLYQFNRFRRGGPDVAYFLGGRPVDPATADPQERRLQNVMEEMAIASGIPPPHAFVQDDPGAVNAFAAGNSTEDAVVAVTRGALQRLDRDELQAVVAHEYSHILNGDSRINLRMMCLSGGLSAVRDTGRFIRLTAWKGAGCLAILTVFFSIARFVGGLAIEAVGWIGVFGGKLLRAAISRQREFLADAAAVQFTRNPLALASALKKMSAAGGADISLRADEASHMFFLQAASSRLTTLFDTHPTIEERLRAIEGVSVPRQPLARAPSRTPGGPAPRLTPEAVLASLGRLDAVRIEYARRLHGRIPGEVLRHARTTVAARGVVCGVLLHDEGAVREAQSRIVASLGSPDVVEAAAAVARCADGDSLDVRLALVELSLPALSRLRPQDKAPFLEVLRALVEADRRRTLFEFAVEALVGAYLQPRPASAERARFESLLQVRAETEQVLWLLALAGSESAGVAHAAWSAGLARLGGTAAPLIVSPDSALPQEVDDRALAALAKLRALAPEPKKALLRAFSACVLADEKVSLPEAGLLRAVSAAIGCPLPPLVAAG